MVDFKKLKNRGKRSTEILSKKAKGGGFEKDKRFWTPTLDKEGNFYGVIRFLNISPSDLEEYEKIEEKDGVEAADEAICPWVKFYKVSIKGPNGFYIENSRASLGRDFKDPVFEEYRKEKKMYDDTGDETHKKRMEKFTGRARFVSNILVIKDTANPDNNGKVFLFEYGPQIFKKIENKFNPKFEEEEKYDPFDFDDGANFIMKVYSKKVGRDDMPTYENCEFSHQTALFDGDSEKVEEVWKKSYGLQEFVDPKNFKPYDELKKRFDFIMGKEVEPDGPSIEDDIDDMTENLKSSESDEPPFDVDDAPSESMDTSTDDYKPDDSTNDDEDDDDWEAEFKKMNAS